MAIRYSEASLLDLQEVIDAIAEDSLERALSYADKLKSKIELLAAFPRMGVECRKKNIEFDCRVYIFESYLIFYRIADAGIEVRRVLHGSRNYKSKDLLS